MAGVRGQRQGRGEAGRAEAGPWRGRGGIRRAVAGVQGQRQGRGEVGTLGQRQGRGGSKSGLPTLPPYRRLKPLLFLNWLPQLSDH